MKTYAGLGDIQTPELILEVMRITAILLVNDGYSCVSGGCIGAEQAFINGTIIAGGLTYLHLPWLSFEEQWVKKLPKDQVIVNVLQDDDYAAFESVKNFHPGYKKLSPSIRAINARYLNILNTVSFMICWTNNAQPVGSTGQAIRLATYIHIPVYNLGNQETLDKMIDKINQRKEELIPYQSIDSGIFR